MFRQISFIVVVLLTTFLSADQFDGKVILRVNGHDHYLPDIFGQYFVDTYLQQKDSLENLMVGEETGGTTIKSVTLGDRITSISYTVDEDPETFKMKIIIKSNSVKIKNWLGSFLIGFNLHLNVTAEKDVDSLGLVVGVTDVYYELKNVHSEYSWWTDWFVDLFLPLFKDNFTNEINDIEGQTFTLIPISTFNGQSADSIIAQVDPVAEATRLLQSFPFDINFNYMDYDVITNLLYGFTISYQALVINLDLLPGYYENGVCNDQYKSTTPEPVTDPTFDWGGFGINCSGVFDIMSRRYPGLTWEERVDTTFYLIHETMGLNHVRIDAEWNKIDSSINDISSSLNPDDITIPDVDDYISEIESEGGWNNIRYVIRSAVRHGLIPYVIVGCGHEENPPRYNDQIIAPGDSIRSNNPDDLANFVAVRDSTYLYWLKLHTMAVVRKFSHPDSGGVVYWQAENELNGARFTETYDWWRKGNAWAEDWDGGFQDQVAEMMYNAIHDAAESVGVYNTQVIQDFHMFTLARRLETWKDWYDVVGLNAYPNEMCAYPVLGFLNGELVWSARRILKYLGDQYGSQYKNKEVWFIETGYGGKYDEGDITFPSFIDSCKYYYSYERQSQFLEQSLNSCAQYGANAFNWLLPITPDNLSSNFRTLSDINGFCGLFDQNGDPKPAYQTFIDAFDYNNNGETVTFCNKYNTSNIGGTLSLDKVLNGFSSGSSFKLDADRDFTVITDKDWLPNSDTTDLYKHHHWDTDNTKYLLGKSFNYNNDGSAQDAYFENTESVYFVVDIGGTDSVEIAKQIKIRDPWYVNALGKQTNEFLSLETTTDTTIYQVFLEQDPSVGMQCYSIEAPYIGGVYQDHIYVFDYWSAAGGDVDFVDGTSSRETDVVIDDPGVTITAVYEAVDQIPNYSLEIPSDESLSIPAGTHLQLADGFKFNILGSLDACGSEGSPVIFETADKSDIWEGFYINLYETDDCIQLLLSGCIIKNAKNVLWFDNSISSIEYAKIDISNCVFSDLIYENEDLEFGNYNDDGYIIWYCDFSTSQNVRDVVRFNVDRCTFNGGKYLLFRTSVQATDLITISNTIFNDCSIYIDESYVLHYYNNDFYNCEFNNGYDISDMNFYIDEDEYNIDSDPFFINLTDRNFKLKSKSPCIDNGWENIVCDPDGTPADIGAFYFPQTTISGTIDSDTTWYGRITVTGDVTVSNGAELIIEPGTLVMFNSGKEINVYGTLTADGTPDVHIVFTRSDTSSASKSYWDRINISSTASYTFDNIEMYGATYGIRIYDNNGGTVQNSLFKQNYRAFYLYDADNTTIKGCDMINNNYGIYCSNSNILWIEDNLVDSSYYYGIYMYRSDGEITDNVIRNTVNYDGIRAYYLSGPDLSTCYDPDHILINNTIANNNRYGVSASSSSDTDLGSYLFIGTDYLGGFNYFNRGSGLYDVYNYNSGTIKAECNWWSSMYNSGSVDASPTASSLGFSLPKANGGTSPSAAEQLLAKAYYQEKVDSAYTKAITTLNQIAETAPDDDIAWKVILRLARLYRKSGDINGLKKNLDALYTKYSNQLIGKIALDYSVSVYSGERDFQEALNRLTNVISLWSEDPLVQEEIACALFEQGMIYMEMDSVSGLGKESAIAAQNSFNELFEQYPESEAAWLVSEFFGLEKSIDPGETTLPEVFAIRQNYPNPFNPMTTIEYDLPEDAKVTMIVYDIIGREVTRLVDSNKQAGYYKAIWDGKNKLGSLVSSGVYIYRIQAGGFSNTSKMVFIR